MEATHQVFKVSKSTIQKWGKQLKETGDLAKKELHRSFRKIDPEKLKAYAAALTAVFLLACSKSWFSTCKSRTVDFSKIFDKSRSAKNG